MLSYLYVCSLEGIIVLEYTDRASGVMVENESGGGKFREVTLNPVIRVAESSMIERAIELHHKAHEICYIANSVNFPVECKPMVSC
jgi:organic hydroperoxide reductase OsmC/OhrA